MEVDKKVVVMVVGPKVVPVSSVAIMVALAVTVLVAAAGGGHNRGSRLPQTSRSNTAGGLGSHIHSKSRQHFRCILQSTGYMSILLLLGRRALLKARHLAYGSPSAGGRDYMYGDTSGYRRYFGLPS